MFCSRISLIAQSVFEFAIDRMSLMLLMIWHFGTHAVVTAYTETRLLVYVQVSAHCLPGPSLKFEPLSVFLHSEFADFASNSL